MMGVAAIEGFEPSDPSFYDRFRTIPLLPHAVRRRNPGGHSKISEDGLNDTERVWAAVRPSSCGYVSRCSSHGGGEGSSA